MNIFRKCNDIRNILLSSRPEITFRHEVLLNQIKLSMVSPYETDGPAINTFYGRKANIMIITQQTIKYYGYI